MLKQTISFTDYNNEQRSVEEYFHLNEAEIVDMQAHSERGIQADLEDAIKANDVGQVLDFIKMLVHKSYGKKSADGIHFRKSEELTQDFINSAYYSDFLLGLIENDGEKGLAFIQGIMPKKLLDRALAQAQGQSSVVEETRSYAPDARATFAEQQEAARQRLLQTAPTTQDPSPVAAQPQIVGLDVTGAPTTDIHEVASDEERADFQAWKARKAADAQATAQQNQFRVPDEQPLQGFQP